MAVPDVGAPGQGGLLALLVSLLGEKGSSEGFRPSGYGCTSKGSQAGAQLWLRAQHLPR